MAELKAAYEKSEQEYKQHKELINTAAEEADVKKVDTKQTPVGLVQLIYCYIYFFKFERFIFCNVLSESVS